MCNIAHWSLNCHNYILLQYVDLILKQRYWFWYINIVFLFLTIIGSCKFIYINYIFWFLYLIDICLSALHLIRQLPFSFGMCVSENCSEKVLNKIIDQGTSMFWTINYVKCEIQWNKTITCKIMNWDIYTMYTLVCCF